MVFSCSLPASPHHSGDFIDSALNDAFSSSALGLQREILYDHVTSRPPLTIHYSDDDSNRKDDNSSPAILTEDNFYVVAIQQLSTHPSYSQNSPPPKSTTVNDYFDYTDRKDPNNDETLSLSNAHPS